MKDPLRFTKSPCRARTGPARRLGKVSGREDSGTKRASRRCPRSVRRLRTGLPGWPERWRGTKGTWSDCWLLLLFFFQIVPVAEETSRTGKPCWPWKSSGTWGALSAGPAGRSSLGSTSASKFGWGPALGGPTPTHNKGQSHPTFNINF